ncbi:MAG: ABC transporter substrate-binding protein [Rhizobacter sp.]|nr:ABC transporter substrate-binding protein [Rhizobacter sp.]
MHHPLTPADRRRRSLCFALAAAGASPLLAAEPPPELRVYGNLSTLELAPVLLAVDQTYKAPVLLRQGGITSLYGKPGDLPNLVALGMSDVATNSETQGLRYSLEHPGLRIIFTVAEGLYRIVARRSAGIRTLADLRGKRVGTMPRTSSAYYLDRMLRSVGLSEADVKTVPFVAGGPVPLNRMTGALLQGELDAVTIWEPEMQRAHDALGDDAIEFYDPDGYREQFCLYSTDEKLHDAVLRPRIVAFLRALVEASEIVRTQPQQAWPLVAKATKQEVPLIERAWRHHIYPATLLPKLAGLMVEEEVWVAKETGRPPRKRSVIEALIDAQPLQEALRP